MCCLHHLVSAVVLFSSLMEWKTSLGCDNEGTVKISRRRLKRIRPGMKCADILRNVRTVRGKLSGKVNYFHVYGHMDDVLSDDQLSVEQRLNKRCDELAKEAVDCAARRRMAGVVRNSKQLLPRESAAVLVKGVKVTGDLGEAVRFARGMEEARAFLVEQKGWSLAQLDAVDWKSLHLTLKRKNDAFCTWLAKQHSGFCGTRVQVGRYSGNKSADVGCPNCGCTERSTHLCVCMSDGRSRLFKEMCESLEVWLHQGGKTEPELAYWIPKYVEGRGSLRFQDLGTMSPEMSSLAREQDVIGWKNFMEGRISRKFYNIQLAHLKDVSGHLNGKDWVRNFITKLLQITHSQWIFRNITLHDKRGGSLRRKKMEAMRSEAEILACTNPLLLPEESRFLLEMDEDRYITGDGNFHDKTYWLSAMRAAVAAGRRTVVNARLRKRVARQAESKRRQQVAQEGARVRGRITRELNDMSEFPFAVERNEQGKRVLTRGQTMMRIMQCNKRYKPGD